MYAWRAHAVRTLMDLLLLLPLRMVGQHRDQCANLFFFFFPFYFLEQVTARLETDRTWMGFWVFGVLGWAFCENYFLFRVSVGI